MTSPVSAIEAIEKAMEGVKKQADRHYCNALDQFEKTPCLGAEYKMKEGMFGRIEHEAHASANKAMGHHFGMYEAIRQLEPLMREVLALARQAEALERENAEKDAEIAKLREVLADSLSSFRCTQNVDRYPADHWCRRARALLGGENAE